MAYKSYFQPKNKGKYKGKYPIISRSTWERKFMQVCDQHPAILAWSSESIQIPYVCPHTGKNKLYYPDFLIKKKDKNGNVVNEMVEVKPYKESVLLEKASKREKMIVETNMAKWAAAKAWCKHKNIKFSVLTEKQMFNNGKK